MARSRCTVNLDYTVFSTIRQMDTLWNFTHIWMPVRAFYLYLNSLIFFENQTTLEVTKKKLNVSIVVNSPRPRMTLCLLCFIAWVVCTHFRLPLKSPSVLLTPKIDQLLSIPSKYDRHLSPPVHHESAHFTFKFYNFSILFFQS